jgi:hypothetical protein
METATFIPQQEKISIGNAPVLHPWSTPRLQRLNGNGAEKPYTTWSETSSSGPLGGGGS